MRQNQEQSKSFSLTNFMIGIVLTLMIVVLGLMIYFLLLLFVRGFASLPASMRPAFPIVTQAPVHIGIAIDLTGPESQIGKEQQLGAELAQQLFNKKGGVQGRNIQLDIQDTGADQAGAAQAFTQLLNREVIAIVGPTTSHQAFTADMIAQAQGVPVMAPSNTADGIPQIGSYISRVSAGADRVTPHAVAAAFRRNSDIKRVVIAYADNDRFTLSEAAAFHAAVISQTLAVQDREIFTQTFQTTNRDFTTQAANILSLQPDLVIISGLTIDGGLLVKQLRLNGYAGMMIGGDGLSTLKIFEVCAEQCEGLLIAQPYNWESATEINQQFVAAYQAAKKTTEYPPQYTAQMFTAVQVIIEALNQLNVEQPLPELRNALNRQLLSGMTFETPLGVITFDQEGEVQHGGFAVAEIQRNTNGNLIFKIIDD